MKQCGMVCPGNMRWCLQQSESLEGLDGGARRRRSGIQGELVIGWWATAMTFQDRGLSQLRQAQVFVDTVSLSSRFFREFPDLGY